MRRLRMIMRMRMMKRRRRPGGRERGRSACPVRWSHRAPRLAPLVLPPPPHSPLAPSRTSRAPTGATPCPHRCKSTGRTALLRGTSCRPDGVLIMVQRARNRTDGHYLHMPRRSVYLPTDLSIVPNDPVALGGMRAAAAAFTAVEKLKRARGLMQLLLGLR